MQFGKITNPIQLNQIDWHLPSDKYWFKSTPSSSNIDFRLGFPAWGVPTWERKIYPVDAKSKDYLHYYAQSLNCIELNTTFYRIATIEQLQKWAADVPDNFKFAVKMSRDISHVPTGLTNQKLILEHFHNYYNVLGNKLGMFFLQLHESFAPNLLPALEQFLKLMPSEVPLAIEVRHPAWFKYPTNLWQVLADHAVTAIISDVAGRRDVLHMNITAPTLMIRFVGNNLHPTDFTRLDNWVERLNDYRERGINTIYFMIHEPNEDTCPELGTYLLEKLREAGWSNLPDIAIPAPRGESQLSLF